MNGSPTTSNSQGGGKMRHKTCWLAKQYRNGWGLGFCVGNKPTVWLRGIRFSEKKELENNLRKAGIVFVYMKG